MKDIALRVAAKAVIVNSKGEVLILREAPTYKDGAKIGHYGMPGGRVELGEWFLDGLKREVMEETGLTVMPLQPVMVGEWRPVIQGVPHQIVAIFMECRVRDGAIRLSEEHDDYAWIVPAKRHQYDIMSPDCDAVDKLAALRLPIPA
jgi:8-oxo-dGTP diphosphatase